MKKYFLLIPTIIYPFFILFLLISMFTSSDVPAFNEMWEKMFSNNAFVALFILLLVFILLFLINIGYLIISLFKKWNPLEMSKIMMIVKLIQIPAYIGIFIVGLLCLITVFTFPIALFLIFMDSLCILLSGLVMIPTIIRSKQDGYIGEVEAIIYTILSFCFNVDVVASILLYIRNRNKLVK